MNKPNKNQMRAAARAIHTRVGWIEIDADAKIARGNGPGAFVQAWVWVFDDQAAKYPRKVKP